MVRVNNKYMVTCAGTKEGFRLSRLQRKRTYVADVLQSDYATPGTVKEDSTYLEQEIIVCTFGHLVCLTWLELKYSRRIDSTVTLSDSI